FARSWAVDEGRTVVDTRRHAVVHQGDADALPGTQRYLAALKLNVLSLPKILEAGEVGRQDLPIHLIAHPLAQGIAEAAPQMCGGLLGRPGECDLECTLPPSRCAILDRERPAASLRQLRLRGGLNRCQQRYQSDGHADRTSHHTLHCQCSPTTGPRCR